MQQEKNDSSFSPITRSSRKIGKSSSNPSVHGANLQAKTMKNEVNASLPSLPKPTTNSTANRKRKCDHDGSAAPAAAAGITEIATMITPDKETRGAKRPRRSEYQYSGAARDIDEPDRDNELMATAYVQDIFAMHGDREVTNYSTNRPGFLKGKFQLKFNGGIRANLINWLVETDNRLGLSSRTGCNTLYLAVSLIDRYLSKTKVQKEQLELIAITCFWIASKYENNTGRHPQVRHLLPMCNGAWDGNDIVAMEQNILETLQYRVAAPTAREFLDRYLKAANASAEMTDMAYYLLDGSLQSYDLLEILPSQVAAAIVLISRNVSGLYPWSPTLLKYTEYSEGDAVTIAHAVLGARTSESFVVDAINEKYAGYQFRKASTLAYPDLVPGLGKR